MNQTSFFLLCLCLLLIVNIFTLPATAQEKNTFTQIKQQIWLQLVNFNLQKKNSPIIVAHPDYNLVLINKHRYLPANYKPDKLAIPNVPFLGKGGLPKKHLQFKAAHALEKMFAQAHQVGITLVGVSGYRSYHRQKELFNYYASKLGRKKANQLSAKPGASEHQTGLAVDISCPAVNYQLTRKFAATQAGQWLQQNAYKYGFIIRYPQNKTHITGYHYEPWHLRYVGTPHAQIIHTLNITLENYLSTSSWLLPN